MTQFKPVTWEMIGITILNFIVTFPIAYLTYKWYPIHLFPQDCPLYIELSRDVIHSTIAEPFRYRILTPLLVNLSAGLPYWHTQIVSQFEARNMGIFFRYITINYIWILATGTAFYYWFRNCLKISAGVAELGALSFMVSYPVLSNGYMPMADAGAFFFITLLFIAFHHTHWRWAAMVSLVGVLQKETVIIVAVMWLFLLFGFQREWGNLTKGLVTVIPAWMLYHAMTVFVPAGHFLTGSPIGYLSQIRSVWSYINNPDTWSQLGLGNLGFIAALIAHGALVTKRVKVDFPMHWLFMFIGLFLISVILNIGPGNAARICAFGAPIYWGYQLLVLEGWLNRWGFSAGSNRLK